MHDQQSNIYIDLCLSYSWSFGLLGIWTFLVTPCEKSAPMLNTLACLQAASGMFPPTPESARCLIWQVASETESVFHQVSDWNSLNSVMTEGYNTLCEC